MDAAAGLFDIRDSAVEVEVLRDVKHGDVRLLRGFNLWVG